MKTEEARKSRNVWTEERFERVARILGTDKAERWFTTPHPAFGDVSPGVMIMLGRGHKVDQFITAAEKSTPPAATSQAEQDGKGANISRGRTVGESE